MWTWVLWLLCNILCVCAYYVLFSGERTRNFPSDFQRDLWSTLHSFKLSTTGKIITAAGYHLDLSLNTWYAPSFEDWLVSLQKKCSYPKLFITSIVEFIIILKGLNRAAPKGQPLFQWSHSSINSDSWLPETPATPWPDSASRKENDFYLGRGAWKWRENVGNITSCAIGQVIELEF